MPTRRKSTRRKRRKSTGGKRKLNAYFKLMMEARKKDLSSFTYKGKCYVKKVNDKTSMVYYKKK